MSKIKTSKVNTKESKNKKLKSRKTKPMVKEVSKNKANKAKKKKSFFNELIENVEYGAKLVGEKTSEIGTEAFEKVKKSTSEVVGASTKVVSDLYSSASDYTEQFKDKIEMKKLNSQRVELTSELGTLFYKKYKIEKVTFSKFSKTREFSSLLKNINKLDEEIIELGEHLSNE